MTQPINNDVSPTGEGDLYLKQMVNDLAEAEKALRGDICYRGMSFSQQRLDDSQSSVDRLHDLIRSYLVTKVEEVSHDTE